MNATTNLLSFLAALLPLLSPSGLHAATLNLEDYLSEVRQANQSLQISNATIKAGELRRDSTDIMFSPQFFSQASHTSDSKEPTSALAPEEVAATNMSFGIQKLWESGLQSQVTYSVTRVNLNQPDLPASFPINFPLPNPAAPGGSVLVPVNVPNPFQNIFRDEYTEAKTQLDLVQPLLRNSQGRDHQMVRDTARTKIELQKLAETYKAKTLLAQAEFVYWQLALAQEAIRNQEGTIERLKKIRSWAQNRARSQLGDRVDFLQADAGLRAKTFELEVAKKDRNSLQRTFNTLRGKSEGDVALVSLSTQKLVREGEALKSTDVRRLDIEMAKQSQKLAELEVAQNREKYKSQLDVFGSLALNELDDSTGKAMAGALGTEHPTVVVGLKFSTPLSGDLIARDQQGLAQAAMATSLDKDYKEFTARQDFEDLQAQLREGEVRMRLASELEDAQKQKLTYERERLTSGRTTTYQILSFENEYAQSQLALIRVKAEMLGVLAKLKAFGVD